MSTRQPSIFRFNRRELSGSLGDLGTLLPLALGMTMINGIDPMGTFFSIGLFYIASGLYFRVTVPVQPMKIIGAYAIATGLNPQTILAAGLTMSVILLVLGSTGAIATISKYTHKSVVRGVQLATGVLLIRQGIYFILGTSRYQSLHQAAEPYLSISTLGPIPIGWVLGILGILLTLLLLENKTFPAGLVMIGGGGFVGLVLGTGIESLEPGIYLPNILPFGWPGGAEFSMAIIMLVLPQLPMSVGNAVIAYVDLSREYFKHRSNKLTYRSVCISMAIANAVVFFVGGIPLCHGAGGLAAHYRFGARTAGSNVIIGTIFIFLAFILGKQVVAVSHLIPISILGVLLVFAGAQLAMAMHDVKNRKDTFVIMMMIGITLASNLATAFVTGVILAYLLQSNRLSV